MFLLLLKMRTVGLWAWVWVNIQQQISWVSKETFLELLTSCNFCGKYLEISSCRHQRNSSQQQQLIFSKSLPMGGGSDPQKHHRYVNWKNGWLEESRIIFDCNYSRIHCAFFLYNQELQRNDVNAAFSWVKRTNTGLTCWETSWRFLHALATLQILWFPHVDQKKKYIAQGWVGESLNM